MHFEIGTTVEILSATPSTFHAILGGLSARWTSGPGVHEGWSPYDVVGHMIHGEETDWIPRAKIILAQRESGTFEPFDRFAQFERSKGKSMADLLGEFEQLRQKNLSELRSWNLTEGQLRLKAAHPELGEVTLRQLLATWAVHDLNHIRQIVTTMAKKYENEVGPWKQYLSILN